MKSNSPKVVILSGPSGSGKTTIVERLLSESSVSLQKCVSATTRPARPGEVDGVAYYFMTPEDFEAARQANQFLETAEVHGAGYWYGTLKSEVDRAFQQNAWAFLEIDVEGAIAAMEVYPDAITVFLTLPSIEEYERRLRGRRSESEAMLKKRLQTALKEVEYADRYRHVVVNDDLDAAVKEISQILESSCSN
ncbi:guanylate kinase [Thalassoroseus pseudoceratinae]|uniref:guanylate kinase n=1 Tax=Thalassoroseus pseudoceratinae TaxID=2713176 RepID=UPI0014243FB4|nr:guanylate kinase [Thalassoroseus pseudoceratinae]